MPGHALCPSPANRIISIHLRVMKPPPLNRTSHLWRGAVHTGIPILSMSSRPCSTWHHGIPILFWNGCRLNTSILSCPPVEALHRHARRQW